MQKVRSSKIFGLEDVHTISRQVFRCVFGMPRYSATLSCSNTSRGALRHSMDQGSRMKVRREMWGSQVCKLGT